MDQNTTTPPTSEKQQPQHRNTILTTHHQNQQTTNTRTSFLIEDILYRHQKEMATTFPSHYHHPQTSKTNPGYFHQNFQQQQQQSEAGGGGYVQVMGALGAYLGATTPYNSISDPYFLAAQGTITMLMHVFGWKLRNKKIDLRFTVSPCTFWYWWTVVERFEALQTEESAHCVQWSTVDRVGEAFFGATVSVHAREGGIGKCPFAQWNAGENVVSEQADETQKADEKVAGGTESRQ